MSINPEDTTQSSISQDELKNLQFIEGHCGKCGNNKVKREEIKNGKHYPCGGTIIGWFHTTTEAVVTELPL